MPTILITGANRGIGLALTTRFLAQGHNVLATARNPDQAEALQQLGGTGDSGQLTLIPMEVTEAASVAEAARMAGDTAASLDFLINNAGLHPEKGDESIRDLELDFFTEAFAVNVIGAVRVCQAFLPLLERGQEPRLIQVSSGAGSVSTRQSHQRYCYGASKAALNHVTRGLAHELEPAGILVVAMSPGWVRTDMGGPEADHSPEETAGAMADTILKLGLEHHGLFLDRHGRTDTYAW